MKKLNLLDCTLRDGGYYNNWDFNPLLVKKYIDAMSKSKIDIVEIGFRSDNSDSSLGPYAYSTESLINKIIKKANFDIAVMINGKDLLKYNKNNINSIFIKKKLSKIKYIRIACHFNEVKLIVPVSKLLKRLGYSLIINFMGTGLRTDKELRDITKIIDKSKVFDVIYFADSFGNMLPEDVERKYIIIKKIWKKDIGFHAHNNFGLALANAIKAMQIGINWIDSTILGMGRGAGNIETETLVYYLKQKKYRYNHQELLELSRSEFQPLKNKYDWGTNPFYYIAALNKIHPTYTQELLAENRYDSKQIVRGIELLSSTNSSKYDFNKLQEVTEIYENKKNGTWNANGWCKDKDIIILGAGNSIEKYKKKIESILYKKNSYCISLNINKFIDKKYIDYYASCHLNRIIIESEKFKEISKKIFIPKITLNKDIKKIFTNKLVIDYGLNIDKNTFKINNKYCILPSPLAIGYALSIAAMGKAKRIILVGFDGYKNNKVKQLEMRKLLTLYSKNIHTTELLSITPTTYKVKYLPISNFK